MAYIKVRLGDSCRAEFIVRVDDKYKEEAKKSIDEVIATCNETEERNWSDYYNNINECVVNNYDGEIINIDYEIEI